MVVFPNTKPISDHILSPHNLPFPGMTTSIPLSTKDRKRPSLKVSSTAAFALKTKAAMTLSPKLKTDQNLQNHRLC